MTQIERDIRTEELLMRSQRLREELGLMIGELETYVAELDDFIQHQSPEGATNAANQPH